MDNSLLFRAIIVDDEKRGISALKLLLEKFIEEVTVIAECLKAEDAISVIESYKPEIVFLDIDMPEMNGFEMLEKLNWKNFNLIFTTAHEEYGLRALKNNAVDYLLKPISHKDLRQAVNRIKQKLGKNEVTIKFNYNEFIDSLYSHGRSRLLINSISGSEYIDLGEVICMESQSNYTRIRLSHSPEILTRRTLKEFEAQLCHESSDFLRVHNSFIINLHKVSRYLKTSEEIVLEGETKIPLSKARRDIFFKWMNI